MSTIPGSSSGKIPRREKILSLFAAEFRGDTKPDSGSSSAGIPATVFPAESAGSPAAVIAAEFRALLLALTLIIAGMEAFLLYSGAAAGATSVGAASGGALALGAAVRSAASGGSASVGVYAFPRGAFVLAAVLFYLFYTVLEYIFRPFAGRRAASLLPILPAALLFFLFRNAGSLTVLPESDAGTWSALSQDSARIWPVLSAAVAVSLLLRLFFALVPRRDLVLLCGVFVPDAAAAFLYFAGHVLTGRYPSDKLLWVALMIMTLSSLQALLFERKGEPFPFSYFALMGILLLLLPMGQKPIDWSPFVRAGEHVVRFVAEVVDGASYHLSSIFDDGSYTAGYSSLNVGGGKVRSSEKTQLLLETEEDPFFLFKDEETSKVMRMHRTVYLAGGRGADRQQLVSFLRFMHGCGVDRDYASLFSQVSKMDVEYAYLNTSDEISPAFSLMLTAGGRTIGSGTGASEHKKGYRISALYLDVDYGSPYLTALFRKVTRDGGGADSAGEAASVGEVASAGEVASVDEVASADDTPSAGGAAFSYEEACGYMETLYGVDLSTLLTRQEFEDAAAAMDKGVPTGVDALSSGSSGVRPQGASGRLKDLAASLTDEAGSGYDKCKRIEGYLRQYTYDTNTAGGYDPQSDLSTPEGMYDIADRFLFETGAGYCVHYTASMVTLLRLAGIPARAVSGFRYVFPVERDDAYAVSGNCAHVWPEAYLAGIGWIPFEPTAAYRTAAEYTWHRKAATAPSEKNGLPSELSDTEFSDSELLELPESISSQSEIPPTIDPASAAPEPQDLTARELAIQALRIVLPVILCIAVLLAALIAGTISVRSLRYRRGTPEQKLLMDVDTIKTRLRKLYGENFTDRGLMTDYVELAPEALRSDLQVVVRAYYRVVYGGGSAGGLGGAEARAGSGGAGNGAGNGGADNGGSCSGGVTAEESALAGTLRDKLKRINKRS